MLETKVELIGAERLEVGVAAAAVGEFEQIVRRIAGELGGETLPQRNERLARDDPRRREADLVAFAEIEDGIHAGQEVGVAANDPVGGEIAQHPVPAVGRSEEHTSELQSLMRSSYAVFCLKKKNRRQQKKIN